MSQDYASMITDGESQGTTTPNNNNNGDANIFMIIAKANLSNRAHNYGIPEFDKKGK
jgi:hypothetical protein